MNIPHDMLQSYGIMLRPAAKEHYTTKQRADLAGHFTMWDTDRNGRGVLLTPDSTAWLIKWMKEYDRHQKAATPEGLVPAIVAVYRQKHLSPAAVDRLLDPMYDKQFNLLFQAEKGKPGAGSETEGNQKRSAYANQVKLIMSCGFPDAVTKAAVMAINYTGMPQQEAFEKAVAAMYGSFGREAMATFSTFSPQIRPVYGH